MTKEYIRLYLTNRFLHGYTLGDPEYEKITQNLYAHVKANLSGHTLQELLKESVGNYNPITADIYLELAIRYLRFTQHRTPTISAAFAII